MRNNLTLISVIISIFVSITFIFAQYDTDHDKVNVENLNVQHKKLDVEQVVFNGHLDNEPVPKKARKQRIKKQDPLIGLKQMQFDKSPRSRSSRVINLPDNWDKNPWILQTYK